MFRKFLERVGRLGLIVGVMGSLGCGVTLSPPGFVHEHRHSLCRGWFDFNSHRRPSFTFERYDHLPPNSARVKLFRWRHGGSVETVPQIQILKDTDYASYDSSGLSTSDNCPETIAPPVPIDNRDEPMDAKPEVVPPPPAPPSETQEPIFPEINSPKREIINSIATAPRESANGQLKVTMWVIETEEAPQDSSGANGSIPLTPPPPAPPAE